MKHYFIDIFLLLTYSHCLPAVLVMLNNPRFCINIHSVHIYHLYWILDTSCGHFPTSILRYFCLCWLPKWFFIRVEFRGWCFRRCAGGGGAAAAFSVVPETASNCSISDYIRRMQARHIVTSPKTIDNISKLLLLPSCGWRGLELIVSTWRCLLSTR